jgi:enterochelin esterase-like enzyme
MDYRIYLPPCYAETDRTYPTLYMLPGNNQTEAIWDSLGLDETAESAIQSKRIPPLIIVMPAGGWIALNSSGGPSSYESVIIDDLIPFIEANYCAWPGGNGRAIGGLSRGGYWALEIAFRHPEQFASVGGHSASLLDITAGPDLNPQYTGLTRNLGDLRIYLDIGENDGGIGNTRRLHEDLTAQDIPHTWVLNSGGHDNAYWMAHLQEYLVWYSTGWTSPPPTCTLR